MSTGDASDGLSEECRLLCPGLILDTAKKIKVALLSIVAEKNAMQPPSIVLSNKEPNASSSDRTGCRFLYRGSIVSPYSRNLSGLLL